LRLEKIGGPTWHFWTKKMDEKSNWTKILAPPRYWLKIRHYVISSWNLISPWVFQELNCCLCL